jgi:hypothetical protein
LGMHARRAPGPLLTHTLENVGESELRVISIELKSPK